MGDEIMQGFLISLFVLCGVSSVGWIIKQKLKPKMKTSSSHESLNSLDPQPVV